MYPDLIPVWRAFGVLNSARPSNGMSQCPIPVSDIAAYLDIIGIVGNESKMEYLHLIRAMDDEYLKYVVEQMKQERQRSEAKHKTPPPRR